MTPYEKTDERPIRSKTPEAYESGAILAKPTEKLEKTENWSTGDYNLRKQRKQTHSQALENEDKHFNAIHPYFEPKGDFVSKKKRGE